MYGLRFNLILAMALLIFFPLDLAQPQTVVKERGPAIPDLPDAGKPFPNHGGSPHISPSRMGSTDEEPDELLTYEPVHNPLWQQLERLDPDDRSNASIQIEVPASLATPTLLEIRKVEHLWNSGAFDAALRLLRGLERPGLSKLSMGISWKTPRAVTSGKWGGDVQIESEGTAAQTCIDFEDGTGNLFVVVRRAGGNDPRWTLNMSTDGGETWAETYTWTSSYGEVTDTNAAVVDEYLYIGYVATDLVASYSAARMRRASTNDGSIDTTYGEQIVFDYGNAIWDIAVTSNEDMRADRVYCVAILDDYSLVCHYASADGLIWNVDPTGINDAESGLDASWNENTVSGNYLVVSYINVNKGLWTALRGSCWTITYHDFPLYGTTAISAYEDHIIVVYEYEVPPDMTIKYWISYDGGATWKYWWVAPTGQNRAPDVTARRGSGIAVTWNEEAGAFDPCWLSRRSYPISNWTTPVTYNDTDAHSGLDMSIEWMPPLAGSADAFGTCWIEGSTGNRYAMFDRTTFTLSSAPDPLVSGASATFTVSDAKINTLTYLAYSLAGTGSTYVAALDVTLDLASPVQAAAPITTDDVGGGEWVLTIPPVGAGRSVWLQAVQQENMSNVIATSIL